MFTEQPVKKNSVRSYTSLSYQTYRKAQICLYYFKREFDHKTDNDAQKQSLHN